MELNDIKEPAIGIIGFVLAKMFTKFEKNTSDVGALRERIGQLEQKNTAAFREIDLLRDELKDLRHGK